MQRRGDSTGRGGRHRAAGAVLAAALGAAVLVGVPQAALAQARPRGNDVSFPQCGSALPAGASFGVVGVDGGRPFEPNPCLAEQIAWARGSGRPAYYVNTADPGPALSTHWPVGQRWPRRCTRAVADSPPCAYDYGWNAARDSLARASAAAAAVGAAPVRRSAWWLDVELHNSWESLEHGGAAAVANDTAVLAGMRGLLRHRGVRRVGVYSTVHQWQRITGGARLGRAPVWYAGTGSAADARRHCSRAWSFTGGPVRLSQFLRRGFDADLRC